MKKGLLSFIIGAGILIFLTANVLYHSGSPGGKTGSPGDGDATCTQCHTGTANTVTGWITSNIPGSGYIAGQTYTITASGTHSGVVYFGFELTAENTSNQKTGTFIITDPSQTKLVNNGKAVTHTQNGTNPSGNSKSWSMNWTAPGAGTGNVTFYAAFNAANGNGGTSGDVIYKSSLAVSEGSVLDADFVGNPTTVCPGGTVQFTDLTIGDPTQWQWTFNGGTPSSSTQQNPSVVYNTPGTYSVTLWVSNGVTNDQITRNNYITVLPAAPPVPGTPGGLTQLCQNPLNTQYTTSGSSGATSYIWQIDPAAAGVISGSGTTGTVNWTDDFTGTATLRVKALNQCGESEYSDPLEISIISVPEAAATPNGPDYIDLFYTQTSEYTTEGSLGATSLEWALEPTEAGSLTPNGETSVLVTWNPEFLGEAMLMVRGVNECGPGEWSEALAITIDNTVGFGDRGSSLLATISPNPNNGTFRVTLFGGASEAVTLSVVNLLGKVVYEEKGLVVNGDFRFVVELTGSIPQGIYFLRVENASEAIVQKFIIQ